MIGGDRPVEVQLPDDYQDGVPAPLLLLLHGYGVSGGLEDLYLQLGDVAAKKGFLFAHPDGTVDSMGFQFWNATDACCDYDASNVDDSGYLASVITEIEAAYAVDPKRVYVMGHSNGAYMAYRMACDHADQVAAIVSLAGAMWEDPSECAPTEPVSVLEIHGDADNEVDYEGAQGSGAPGDGPYPSAETSVEDWATYDGCSLVADDSQPPIDLDEGIRGAETTVEVFADGCDPGGEAQLWTIHGGSHLPGVGDTFRERVFAFMTSHAKP